MLIWTCISIRTLRNRSTYNFSDPYYFRNTSLPIIRSTTSEFTFHSLVLTPSIIIVPPHTHLIKLLYTKLRRPVINLSFLLLPWTSSFLFSLKWYDLSLVNGVVAWTSSRTHRLFSTGYLTLLVSLYSSRTPLPKRNRESPRLRVILSTLRSHSLLLIPFTVIGGLTDTVSIFLE